jgi:hypothetical protein
MSGFLEALVARADGRLPVLERRPRALFEPAVGAGATGLPAPDEHVPFSDPTAAPAGDGVATPQRDRRAGPVPAPPEVHGTAAPGPGRLAPPAGPFAPWSVDVGRRAPLPGHLESVRPAAPVPTAQVERRPAARQDGAPPLARPRGEAARVLDTRLHAAPGTAGAAPPPGGSLQPHAAAPGSTLARLARSAATPPRRDALPAAVPARSLVQVSIGRVEIRAVHADTDKSRAAAPAVPKLSLGDYLRARNGGTR